MTHDIMCKRSSSLALALQVEVMKLTKLFAVFAGCPK